jgi:hypothetical protein
MMKEGMESARKNLTIIALINPSDKCAHPSLISVTIFLLLELIDQAIRIHPA